MISFLSLKHKRDCGWESMCLKKLLDCSFRELNSEFNFFESCFAYKNCVSVTGFLCDVMMFEGGQFLVHGSFCSTWC